MTNAEPITSQDLKVRPPMEKGTLPRWIRQALGNSKVLVGGTLTLLILALAFIGPIFFTSDPNATAVTQQLRPPSGEHLLGTDNFGRDILARVMTGIQISVGVGFSVATISAVVGVTLGLLAAYYRRLDGVLMRICDGFMAFPDILLALAIVATLGPSIPNLIACMTLVFWPAIARLIRSAALSAKQQPYVTALRAIGARDSKIIWQHILPNTISTVIVQVTGYFAAAIVIETALSFLGAGVPAPTASIGNMIADGKENIYTAWWMTAVPALALVVLVLGVNLLGDGLRDSLDPKSGIRSGRPFSAITGLIWKKREPVPLR
ncbi:ABC transporter permease [Pseudarthrobacter sp. YAF2]|uniref:ABC transporter permease n=1 Tax=Pseudarthrobacter sp. YAF2 TaxID=3233078 RepID=UPI003F9716FD